eukprot:CAMPEP_0170617794 /NCGR_PEP_ID=MMETSP0224-20130122/26613_1 /TAXON_ID=285029 /ORGANISM="Togula jolla, Strain CCCM 725" /LENGTH=136 /DNA_ID=CAMNT_0010943721 /DNA_START=64 /DNA_END=472 /DNA_ORIENTATION=+
MSEGPPRCLPASATPLGDADCFLQLARGISSARRAATFAGTDSHRGRPHPGVLHGLSFPPLSSSSATILFSLFIPEHLLPLPPLLLQELLRPLAHPSHLILFARAARAVTFLTTIAGPATWLMLWPAPSSWSGGLE